ncbi:hypothetical protein DFH28DRAFT_1181948 [Melampsora americana]|nr:hypothetical protein DFH28DRAFT_1181948 [Melampsora americana]
MDVVPRLPTGDIDWNTIQSNLISQMTTQNQPPPSSAPSSPTQWLKRHLQGASEIRQSDNLRNEWITSSHIGNTQNRTRLQLYSDTSGPTNTIYTLFNGGQNFEGSPMYHSLKHKSHTNIEKIITNLPISPTQSNPNHKQPSTWTSVTQGTRSMVRPPPPPTTPNTSPLDNLSSGKIKETTNDVLQTIQLESDGKVAVIKGASKLPSNNIVFFTKTCAEAQILLEDKHIWTEKADSSLITQPNQYLVLLKGFPVVFQPNKAEHINT